MVTLVISILSGILAGYIASKLQKGQSSGCLVNLFLGIIGAIVGGWLFGLFGIQAYSWIGEIVTSVIGAVVVLWVFAKFK
ncbi:MAG: GlsB/YeaQ/YmgE family stress response membrane protein [Bacteroidaceae bacterium]|nr:GlsB/YeaQ/YmgE family stress response membrane protein [Bacteroidaceae bacterium]